MDDMGFNLNDYFNFLSVTLEAPAEAFHFKSYTKLIASTQSVYEANSCIKHLLSQVQLNKKLLHFNDLGSVKSLEKFSPTTAGIKAFTGLPLMDEKSDLKGIIYVIYDHEQSFDKLKLKSLFASLELIAKIYSNEKILNNYKVKIEALETEKQHLTQSLESTGAGTWLWDIKKNTIDINHRFAEICGYTKEELGTLTIESWTDMVHKEDILDAKMYIDACLNKEIKLFNISFKMKHKLGHYVWINSSGFVTKRSELDEALVMLGCHIDITFRKKFEESLLINQNHLGEIQKHAKIGSWIYDFTTNRFEFSNSYNVLFKGDNDSSFNSYIKQVHKNDKEKVQRSKLELIEQGKEFKITYKIKNENDELITVQDEGHIFKDLNQNLHYAYGIIQDVTKSIKERQNLNLFKSVITNTNDAVLITEAEPLDEPGPKVVYVNEAFTKMTGYKASEIIGKTPRILQGPQSNYTELSKLGKAIRKWQSYEVTTINYKKNGDPFWLNFTVNPVADGKGGYTHYIAIERDVTKQMCKVNYQHLLNKISAHFTEQKTLKTALTKTLKDITNLIDYSYAEIWIPNSVNNEYHLLTNTFTDPYGKQFKESNKIKHLKFGNNLVTQTVNEKKVKYWDNMQNESNFVRGKIAKASSLKRGFTLPLIINEETVGILFLLNAPKLNKSINSNLNFNELGVFLAQEIKRKNLEIEFNSAFNFAPDIITISDKNHYFRKVNPATLKILEYTEHELLSKPITSFVHPDDLELTLNQVVKLQDGKSIYDFENRYITKTGKIIWLSWKATPAFRGGLIYSVAKDITKRKIDEIKLNQLNAQLTSYSETLEQRNQKLKNIAWSQSHEVRAPLARILGAIDSIELPKDKIDKDQELLLNSIKTSGKELDTIINKIVKKTEF